MRPEAPAHQLSIDELRVRGQCRHPADPRYFSL